MAMENPKPAHIHAKRPNGLYQLPIAYFNWAFARKYIVCTTDEYNAIRQLKEKKKYNTEMGEGSRREKVVQSVKSA